MAAFTIVDMFYKGGVNIGPDFERCNSKCGSVQELQTL